MSTGTVSVAEPMHSEIVTRLQIEFAAEFGTPSPTFDVLLPRFQALLSDNAAFALLAGDPMAPAGYAVVTLRPTVYCDGLLAVLDELYVRPPLRRSGIGTAMLDRAIAEVRTRGGGEMHINVDEIDIDARRFYERHQFVNIQPGTDYRMLCYTRELSIPAAT
ncbi:GNAT family N-acetyltransferase [Nocardia carnea]|uniref:GNAT family N-acetyltransferase n=1 Tax=Nocardia carnea TaxID=37328 RepID=UPI00245528B4|nr:GNAT family N-acetyltransferase [Nocardia carnea]